MQKHRSRLLEGKAAVAEATATQANTTVHPTPGPLLQAQHIALAFGAVQALSDVSVDIGSGEILAIIGPNGAGKTSLLNVINGVYYPQRGRIIFHGVERSKRLRPYQVARQGIARTFQNVALFKGMSTLDNLLAGRVLHMHTG